MTYDKLRSVTDRVGAHVFSKVRLSDVIPINSSGISKADFSFALKAHVDFLVTDSEQEIQFCVEFDGPTHREQVQIARDEQKNRLLSRFEVPFIRVNSRYLDDKYRGWDLLTYFVDVWFLSQAFAEAQDRGQISYDEIFDPTSIISDGQSCSKTWPYWISRDLETDIQRRFKGGEIAQHGPSHWVGTDKSGNYRCLAWLFITSELCIYIETGMRGHRFPAVDSSELLSQLAVYDLHRALLLALGGRITASPRADLEAKFADYEIRCSMVSSCCCNLPGCESGDGIVAPNS